MRETLAAYLEPMSNPVTPMESQEIRTRLAAGEDSRAVANAVGVKRIQVAAVKANVTRGR